MTETIQFPYHTIHAVKLADWLDTQPDIWWFVDGDWTLTSVVDFPCPSDELSAALRQINQTIRLFDTRDNATANGEEFPVDKLDDIADRNNNSKARTFLMCWDDDQLQWLLSEDPAATADAAVDAAER